uniref:Uncharacterized protein n=1 Tax=Cacopsylla melanoneura TaxID=428564 RepID=A0A8D8Y6B6_9HEMI
MVASKVSMALWETSFNGLTLKVVPNSTQDSISLSIPSLASSISPSSTVVNIMSDKNNSSELSRDLVKAQREAKKAAKLAAKQKSKQKAQGDSKTSGADIC